jgi:hypothetical protein
MEYVFKNASKRHTLKFVSFWMESLQNCTRGIWDIDFHFDYTDSEYPDSWLEHLFPDLLMVFQPFFWVPLCYSQIPTFGSRQPGTFRLESAAPSTWPLGRLVPEQGPGTESHWVLFGSQNSEFFSDYPLVNIQKAENCHRNSWLTHKQWWFSTVVLVYQRVPDIWIETIGSNHEKMAPVVAPFPEKLKTWRQWAAASSVVLRFCFWDDWWMQMDVPVDRWCGESPQYRFVRLVKCIFF